MTTTTFARHETADALLVVRHEWARLLLAIECPPPAAGWPPRETRGFLRTGGDDEQIVVEDRSPLVLREHPAPANLDALDARLAIERMLYDLADTLAATVQHTEADDPRRWTFRSLTSPGSRAHGPHWASVWIEGRVLDEDTGPEQQLDGTLAPPPFAPLPPHLLHEARRTARTVEGRLLRALGEEPRRTPIPSRVCPWCGSELTLHKDPGDDSSAVTCSTGPSCTAPVPLDRLGRRVWTRGDLVDLHTALATTPQHTERGRAA
ncbi:hypothetical protein [Streptomyces catenulae]|uniref:Uncharacterized protein n=1 Tax=Streptomyces catenulae TaxID=66875 RepID=A0ABV2YYJ0_9ACTN|nr:hypothetical protein [Streptomyces catenulae]